MFVEAISIARAEGFKAGQEAMRERAASLPPYNTPLGNGQILSVSNADLIRALPIEEPPTKS
jgi:hypothetical protein